MDTYHVWITLLNSSYESQIINGLVLKGYTINAANGKTITTTSEYNNYSLAALKVEKDAITARSLYEDVSFVLENIKASYFSIIISEYTQESVWCDSNIMRQDVVSGSRAFDKKLN